MIIRWDISAQHHVGIYEDESEQGDWVKYKDHLTAIEELEYELRYEREQKEQAQEDVRRWKDLHNELYEQQQL